MLNRKWLCEQLAKTNRPHEVLQNNRMNEVRLLKQKNANGGIIRRTWSFWLVTACSVHWMREAIDPGCIGSRDLLISINRSQKFRPIKHSISNEQCRHLVNKTKMR